MRKSRLFLPLLSIISLFIPFATCEDSYAYPTVYPTGTTIYNPGKAFEGYTLYTIPDPNAILLIDMEGNVVHSWEHDGFRLLYAEPLPEGNVLAFAHRLGQDDPQTGLVELDWNGQVVWEIFFDPGERWAHHDFERLKNGNTLILCRLGRLVPWISPKPFYDDHIIEVNPDGNIVWNWYTTDHIAEFGFDAEALQLIVERSGDWSHTNSIQSLPENQLGDPAFKKGNILVSQRETNIVFIIDKATGAIVWRIGPNEITIGQHNPTMLERELDGAGNILIFDNGGMAGYPKRVRRHSRVLEIDPVSKGIVWEYTAADSGLENQTFFSALVSSAQRLPNGNTLIDEGETGRFFEVTPSGEIVWEYINPFTHLIDEDILCREVYRIWRVPLDWPPFEQR